MKVESLSEQQYNSDTISNILFEDENSFSFSRINVSDISVKFSWNSKGINPDIRLISPLSLIFVAVDTYIVGYNYKMKMIALFLRISTNFKWFDTIPNGLAAVAETEIILINVYERCTLRACYGFGDIIMGTIVEQNSMKVDFLIDSEKVIWI